jgi:hypothetical protein
MKRTLAILLLLAACESAEPGEVSAQAASAPMTCPTCKEDGRCEPNPHGCRPGWVGDCRKSAGCINDGWCDLDDGQCVPQLPIP